MAINVAPLVQGQPSQTPDILGGVLQGLQIKNARQQMDRQAEIEQKLPSLVTEYQGGNAGALMQIAQMNPELAQTLVGLERSKQQGTLIDTQIQGQRQQMSITAAQERMAMMERELKAVDGLKTALAGVESPEEKTRIKNLYMKSVEKSGIEIPDLLKGDWSPEMDTDIDHLSVMGNAMFGRMPDPVKLGANERLVNPQTGKEIIGVQGLGKDGSITPELAKSEGELRKEFEGLNKDFREIERSYKRIEKSVESPSAAGDIALVFNYMKMLDPGSTVREGEYATAKNAAGIPDVIRAQWNKLQSGETLAPAQRDDFFSRAGMLYDGAIEGYNQNASRYSDIATQYGYDPNRIVSKATGRNENKEKTPSGVDKGIWDHMTEEERALFK